MPTLPAAFFFPAYWSYIEVIVSSSIGALAPMTIQIWITQTFAIQIAASDFQNINQIFFLLLTNHIFWHILLKNIREALICLR